MEKYSGENIRTKINYKKLIYYRCNEVPILKSIINHCIIMQTKQVTSKDR